jgi:hypothetical protein
MTNKAKVELAAALRDLRDADLHLLLNRPNNNPQRKALVLAEIARRVGLTN